MSLSDPGYLLFLSVVFLVFHLLRPGTPRRWFLLAASYFFYFELSHFYIWVLLYVTAITYMGAHLIASTRSKPQATPALGVVVTSVLLPMIFFKYIKFALDATLHGGWADLALPVGISFFSFAALGYLIDVYLEVEEPQPAFDRVALFLASFPMVTAGPIERGPFMTQLECLAPLSAPKVIQGLRLILVGLLMKVVLADSLGGPVNAVYDAPGAHAPVEVLLAVLFYPFYLYSDFAGYSLIAIGSAELFGFNVRANFQQPFFSTTIPEFWRRWHISLSSWVRDYLFSPLRMQWRRGGMRSMLAAMFLSFVILGVWHGAKWGFFIFGCMHGLYAVCSTATLPWRNGLMARLRVPAALIYSVRVIGVFFLAVVAFVFFRAATLTDVGEIFRAICSPVAYQQLVQAIEHRGTLPGSPLVYAFLLNTGLILFLLVGDLMAVRQWSFERFPPLVQILGYNWCIILIVSCWLTHYGSQPFVYYKF